MARSVATLLFLTPLNSSIMDDENAGNLYIRRTKGVMCGPYKPPAKSHKKGNQECCCSSIEGCKPECIVFNTLELLSLYTIMTVKRYVKSLTYSSIILQDHLPHLIQVIEHNLARLKVEKKWFFATIRDQARLYHSEWTFTKNGINKGLMCYNTILLIVALILGMETLWYSDECLPHLDVIIIDELNYYYGSVRPTLALKQLNQTEPLFEFLSRHSPNLEILHMPRSDATSFQNCVKFRNLRVIELAGGVSDKVMCNALWNVNKKSDKVLELAIKESKDPVSWHLALPHLEALRNNMLETKAHSNTMRIALGAAALVIQPKMQRVESLDSWYTLSAVLYLLNTEAKQKNAMVGSRTVAVTNLAFSCGECLDIKQLKRVVNACPKLSSLTLEETENIHEKLSLLCAVIPMKQIKTLNMDASLLTNLELTVLLAEMRNLEDLTLRLTPEAIINFNVPIEEDARQSMVPTIRTLVIEFLCDGLYFHESTMSLEYKAKDMMSFLASFPLVKELTFSNTLLTPPPYLVYGCIGGSLAVLHDLKQLSVISIHEDFPRELAPQLEDDLPQIHEHYNGVPHMLTDLQDEATFKHLRELESLVIDEFYIAANVDIMIEALRLAGVMVSVLYRPGMQNYPRLSALLKNPRRRPQKIKIT